MGLSGTRSVVIRAYVLQCKLGQLLAWSCDGLMIRYLIGFGLARFPSEYQLDVLLRDRQWCVRTLHIEVLGPLSNPVNGADRPFASGRTLNCYG